MKYFFILAVFFTAACSSSKKAVAPAEALPRNISLNGKLFSALFQQRSAEYRALCLQAFNVARLRINTYTGTTQLPKAIITDIDETILNNSPYAVHQAFLGKEYVADDWYAWTERAAADTMPGAAAFLKFASSKGIDIFYITNRENRERSATVKNLQRFNLPNADEEHLLTKQLTSSKDVRRRDIMEHYEVVLLMGDNLADFSILFDKKTEADRTANTDILASEFGSKYIILPNCNYGDWESILYNYRYNFTQAQKDSVMRKVLSGY